MLQIATFKICLNHDNFLQNLLRCILNQGWPERSSNGGGENIYDQLVSHFPIFDQLVSCCVKKVGQFMTIFLSTVSAYGASPIALM